MRVIFLGGADEVGASCSLLEIDGRNILVDAGVRMGTDKVVGTPKDTLPDLAHIADLGGVDVVLVTHAHLDHIGALPLIYQAYPRAPIYAVSPTVRLMKVLLADALKIMQIKAEHEMEVPLYDAVAVERMFTMVAPIEYNAPIDCGSGVHAHFFPAGHILGASCIGIQGKSGRVLFTGDISVSDQRTIVGASIPKFPADVMVIESTYGNRLHSNRGDEERRLAENVNRVVREGGKALIPAFALGRSQEVILILQSYQKSGELIRCPIWIDGMVRSICEVYTDFPEYLTPFLRRRMEYEENPFYWRRGLARPVISSSDRDKILSGGPCIIVASSGMLNGGASQYYAARLAGNPRNAILITGYQDEESPGRRLLELAQGHGGGELQLGDEVVMCECAVGKYGLSAHADLTQLVGLVSQISPKHVILVHGNDDARKHMARVLSAHDVYLPENGDEFEYVSERRDVQSDWFLDSIKKTSVDASFSGIGKGRELDSEALRLLWQAISGYRKGRRQSVYSSIELAALWYGPDVLPEQVHELRSVLATDNVYFANDWKRPFLYRPNSTYQVELSMQRRSLMKNADRLSSALILVESAAGVVPAISCEVTDTGFHSLEVGSQDTHHYAEELIEIIGAWTLLDKFDAGIEKSKLNEVIREAEVYRRGFCARDLWAKLRLLTGRFNLDDAVCMLDHIGSTNIAFRLAVAWHFAEFKCVYSRHMNSIDDIYYIIEQEVPSQVFTSRSDTEEADANVPLEQNTALAAVDTLIPANAGLYKRGANTTEGILLLYFEFPVVARKRFARELEKLEQVTGWRISINDRPHQGALERAVMRILPEDWLIAKGPSVFVDKGEVNVRCRIPLGLSNDAISKQAVSCAQMYLNETGFLLDIADSEGKIISRGSSDGITATDNQMQRLPTLDSSLDIGNVFYPEDISREAEEINRAYWIIEEHFASCGVRIYKRGKKRLYGTDEEFIEVGFVSPEKGLMYQRDLQSLANEIGWILGINQNPNQHEIKHWVANRINKLWGLVKEPSFFADRSTVQVRLANPPDESSTEWNTLVEEFDKFCGYKLQMVHG